MLGSIRTNDIGGKRSRPLAGGFPKKKKKYSLQIMPEKYPSAGSGIAKQLKPNQGHRPMGPGIVMPENAMKHAISKRVKGRLVKGRLRP